jgi:hypothetical protein
MMDESIFVPQREPTVLAVEKWVILWPICLPQAGTPRKEVARRIFIILNEEEMKIKFAPGAGQESFR